jgi:hypothetical protein
MSEKLLDILKQRFPEINISNDTFAVPEELLTDSPLDWMDFIFFLVYCQDKPPSALIFLSDEEAKKAFTLLVQDIIQIYVLEGSVTPMKVWEIRCTKTETDERIFIGGENFRKFCDRKNIYYISAHDDEGHLLSVSNCQYLKNEGEDCRVPRRLS